jgi:hypothetical protein
VNNALDNLKHNAGNKTAAAHSPVSAARTARPEGRTLNRPVLKRHVPHRRRKRQFSAARIFSPLKQKCAVSSEPTAPKFLVIPEDINFFVARFYGENIAI